MGCIRTTEPSNFKTRLLEPGSNEPVSKSAFTAFQAHPNLTRDELLSRLARMLSGEAVETHRDRIGLLGDLFLIHGEQSRQFTELVGSMAPVYKAIAYLTKSFPYGFMVEFWSETIPWRPGVTDWKRYLWGAMYARFREWNARQAVAEAKIESEVDDGIECVAGLLDSLPTRRGQLLRLGTATPSPVGGV